MKKNLLLSAFILFLTLPVFSQVLYTSTVESGSRFSPGNGVSGTPIIVFDDVLIPSGLVVATDSITITNIKFGIRRLASAPAITVNCYFTVPDDTATVTNTFIKIPPVLIGSVNLPALGANAETTIISLGDSVNALFRIKTDTGALFTGYQTFFAGVSFTGSDPSGLSGWRLTAPQSPNDRMMWLYDADNAGRSGRIFTGTSATFHLQVFGRGVGTLPVTLAEFTAQRSGKITLLNWTTQQELNTKYFEVERSTDGTAYNSIGRVMAAGNSNTLHNYSFTDLHPSVGINYYRLRIIDIDNSSKMSAVRSIRNTGLADVSIYPNPVSDKFNLSVNADHAVKGQLSVTDESGRLVYTKAVILPQGATVVPVNTSKLAAGGYLMKLQLDTDIIYKRFNKQ